MSKYDYRLFVIKPSRIISSLCYSIFKLEPYTVCIHNCIYCYSKWYRGLFNVDPAIYYKIWIKLAEKLSTIEYKPYFRLSTLTDPFQESIEDKLLYSYKLIEVARRHSIPLVINTKSKLVVEKPWINLLIDMAKDKNLLVQISTSTSDYYSKFLEEKAPLLSKRIEVVEKLLSRDIPVVVRLQPIIPGLEEDHVSVLEKVVDKGVLGAIVEPARFTTSDLVYVSSVLKTDLKTYFEKYGWRKYTEESRDLYTPGDQWWFNTLKVFREICGSRVKLTVCKYKPIELDTGDCCLFYLTGCRSFGVRETIREKLFSKQASIHVYSFEEYNVFPKLIRKGLRSHYNKLLKVINDKLFIEKYIGLDKT